MTSIPAARAVHVLEQPIETYGRPSAIRFDHGPWMISQRFAEWREAEKIEVCDIQPGKPRQYAALEQFEGSFRHHFRAVRSGSRLGKNRWVAALGVTPSAATLPASTSSIAMTLPSMATGRSMAT